MDPAAAVEALPDGLLEALTGAEAFPEDASARAGVETVQTHISHVFLSGDRVYKLRKAVRLPFLSFATRAERNADCLNEVSLNRRLSPNVYIGVAPLQRQGADGAWQVGPVSELLADSALEHCVVMRRLPDGRNALSLLESGELSPEQIDRLATRIASFHAAHSLGTPAPIEAEEWLRRTWQVVANTFELGRELDASVLEPEVLDRCEAWLARLLDTRRAHFARRREQGRVVDGHADLRLDHVWFEQPEAEPLVVDCVEFDPELRRIDAACDLSFFAMDLVYHHRRDLAERFLRRYALETDDYDLYAVVDYHVAHRALIRAVVADVAANEDEIPLAQRRAALGSAKRHMDLIEELQAPAAGPGLVLVTGTVGSGKSTVADAAAQRLGATLVSSDRTRKHLAGLATDARRKAAPGEGLYSEAHTREVYEGLLDRAEPAVLSGRVVVLDATFSRETWRDEARRWAEQRGLPLLLLEVRCSEAVALERLAARERDAARVSDAGPEFLAESIRRYEVPGERWAPHHRVVRTDEGDWGDWGEALDAALAGWPEPPSHDS
jgi:aminoglycoside phosphotransferase family enzyme/predicted kinase